MLIRASHLARQLIAERKPTELLRNVQLVRLRRLIDESYQHTHVYRCLMQRAGVRPEDIASLQDIERLPVICKDDLLEFSEQERTHRKRIVRFRTTRIATSGSSGKPFEFFVDSSANAWRKAQYLRPYVTNGRRPWNNVLRLTAVSQNSGSSTSPFRFFREHRISCTAAVEDQLQALEALRPTIVQGYPSALRCLAFELSLREVNTPYVATVFTDSELLTPDSRALIETAFGAPVLDVFGTFETDNIAYQCSNTSDYHFAVDSAILEIARDGAPVTSGDGDLVVTVLNNLTTPFIRYNLQDIVSHTATPCKCGRTFPLIRIAAGRKDDLVLTANGERRSPMSFLWRFDAFSDLIREYQVGQTAIDKFVARVVAQRQLTAAEKEQICAAITADYPNASVLVRQMPRLPRAPAGKLRAFVCEVPQELRGTHGN